MRATRQIVMAGLLSCLGCYSTPPTLKPTLREEYVLPPSTDSRFSSPPTFPRETMDFGNFEKDTGPKAAPKMGDQMNGGNSGFGANGSGSRRR